MHHCRDCQKCTERGMTATIKKWANLALIVCTLGTSVIFSAIFHSGRKLCPVCKHPLSRHDMMHGIFQD